MVELPLTFTSRKTSILVILYISSTSIIRVYIDYLWASLTVKVSKLDLVDLVRGLISRSLEEVKHIWYTTCISRLIRIALV